MAKGGSRFAEWVWKARRSSLNSGAPLPVPMVAQERVLGIQRKLHKRAQDDQDRRFADLHNLVCDPATLVVAWQRVRTNRGSRSAGVDGQTAAYVEKVLGVEKFLGDLREELRSGGFRPDVVKQRAIPKRWRQAALSGDRDGARPCRSGRSEAGARTDLRGRVCATRRQSIARDERTRPRSPRRPGEAGGSLAPEVGRSGWKQPRQRSVGPPPAGRAR